MCVQKSQGRCRLVFIIYCVRNVLFPAIPNDWPSADHHRQIRDDGQTVQEETGGNTTGRTEDTGIMVIGRSSFYRPGLMDTELSQEHNDVR